MALRLVVLVAAVVAIPSTKLHAQAPPDSVVVDSTALVPDSVAGTPVDTAVAGRIGLPTAPTRTFPQADSVLRALLELRGFRPTRFAADSLTFFAVNSNIDLTGRTLLEREGMTLEADTVRFQQDQCQLDASGRPTMFEGGTVMVGNRMAYDTCRQQALVDAALTNFNQSGVEWFLRGGLGIDSGAVRLYAGHGEITSCTDPEAHYHFRSGKVKWVSNSWMVARPVTLYVRDVPVFWAPFLFQDMRQGRRSGLLAPRFGINDIIRPNEGYRRHITNVGYYVAVSDYVDFEASLDWFDETSVSLNGEFRYNWLDRFMRGGVAVSRIYESGQDGVRGRRSLRLGWNHQQQFDMRTSLRAQVDYATSSSVVQQNSVDPYLQVATLGSSLNFSKSADWGTINLGGNASQDLSNDVISMTLPTLSLTPRPIDFGDNVTWSPDFSMSTRRTFNRPSGTIEIPPLGGVSFEPDSLTLDSRETSIRFGTPLRIGRWNWQNSFSVVDNYDNGRGLETFPDPNDSTGSITRVRDGDFETSIDWSTAINLPSLFPASWKLQPSVGIQNSTSGPFLLRNRFTGGRFVQQGKRLSFSAGVSPTVFGFFPGVGPVERIRHSFAPSIRWNFAPAANVPEEYARARNPTATELRLRSDPTHSMTFSMSNTIEGKYAGPDSAQAANAPKLKMLSLQTSPVVYNFEQAKEPGRNGWQTQTISNSMTSDLLRGFTMSMTHDLWRGQVGMDSSAFDPFLQSVSARFSLSGATIGKLIGAITGGGEPLTAPDPNARPDSLDNPATDPFAYDPSRARGTSFPGLETYSRGGPRRGSGLDMSFSYNEQRRRTVPTTTPSDVPSTNRTLQFDLSFSPTEHWSLSWDTQYNFTTGEFGQHVLRFDRDLHRWRATFSVVSSPNGNFAFNFFINLLDQPEIKFNYDQRSVDSGQ